MAFWDGCPVEAEVILPRGTISYSAWHAIVTGSYAGSPP